MHLGDHAPWTAGHRDLEMGAASPRGVAQAKGALSKPMERDVLRTVREGGALHQKSLAL